MFYKELYFSVLLAVLSEALLQKQPDHHWLSRANYNHLATRICSNLIWVTSIEWKSNPLQWAARSCLLYPSYFPDPVSYSFPFALWTAATLTSSLLLETRHAVTLRPLHYLFLLLRRVPLSLEVTCLCSSLIFWTRSSWTILVKISTHPWHSWSFLPWSTFAFFL